MYRQYRKKLKKLKRLKIKTHKTWITKTQMEVGNGMHTNKPSKKDVWMMIGARLAATLTPKRHLLIFVYKITRSFWTRLYCFFDLDSFFLKIPQDFRGTRGQARSCHLAACRNPIGIISIDRRIAAVMPLNLHFTKQELWLKYNLLSHSFETLFG